MSPKQGRKEKLAYQDPNFMDSTVARPVRIITEYSDPKYRLRQEGVADTIVMFGSARILPKDRATTRLKNAKNAAARLKTPAAQSRVRLCRNALAMRSEEHTSELQSLRH